VAYALVSTPHPGVMVYASDGTVLRSITFTEAEGRPIALDVSADHLIVVRVRPDTNATQGVLLERSRVDLMSTYPYGDV